MSFNGFTEDDINKLKKSEPITNIDKATTINKQKKTKTVTFKNNIQPVLETNQKILNGKLNTKHETTESYILNEAKLFANKPTGDNIPEINVQEPECKKSECIPINLESRESKKKMLDLNEFQAKQKFMEEQNRKRKELLVKALADRTKQTQEEAQRLSRIQTEFKKLDAILSNDVKILRKQIEVASVDYMEAQKRYYKVEKEFLEAKLSLQQKLEKKEMLTEHLCAIIEKNEERKAEKLTELLEKLKINPNDDSAENKNLKQETNIHKISNSSSIVESNSV